MNTAPKIFSMAYAVVKPFLHERTRNKINIFSYDQKQWKEAILEEINPEEVPACYGGTLTDPDGNPNCITMVSRVTHSISLLKLTVAATFRSI